jgi:serine/threonine protein kinase
MSLMSFTFETKERSSQEYEKLPSAQSIVFNVVPKVPLAPLLPNLPPSYLVSQPSPVLDILTKFLKYPPSARLSASDALQHPWFTTSAVLCLPQDYKLDQSGFGDVLCYEYNGRMFGELLVSKLTSASSVN